MWHYKQLQVHIYAIQQKKLKARSYMKKVEETIKCRDVKAQSRVENKSKEFKGCNGQKRHNVCQMKTALRALKSILWLIKIVPKSSEPG